eukprot:366501-Chlamydomonas_euryale.AAC.28
MPWTCANEPPCASKELLLTAGGRPGRGPEASAWLSLAVLLKPPLPPVLAPRHSCRQPLPPRRTQRSDRAREPRRRLRMLLRVPFAVLGTVACARARRVQRERPSPHLAEGWCQFAKRGAALAEVRHTARRVQGRAGRVSAAPARASGNTFHSVVAGAGAGPAAGAAAGWRQEGGRGRIGRLSLSRAARFKTADG